MLLFLSVWVLFVVWMDFVVVFAVVDFQRHGGIAVWLFWIWALKIDWLLGCWVAALLYWWMCNCAIALDLVAES